MDCDQRQGGMAFNVVFDELVKPPKTLSLFQNKQSKKETITLGQIKEKQLLAEKRRQQKIEARLKRIQQREESSRKLVESVEVLLEQKLLRTGELKGSDVPKMSSREIMKTANDAAQRFKELQEQLLSMDLKVNMDSTEQMLSKNAPNANTVGIAKVNLNFGKDNYKIQTTAAEKLSLKCNERKMEAVAFEIPVLEVKRTCHHKKGPPITSLSTAKKMSPRRKVTAEELNEKQQRAAERRQKKREEKVKRT